MFFFERKDAKLVPQGGSNKVANGTCREAVEKLKVFVYR
jgi:hypothetical protein